MFDNGQRIAYRRLAVQNTLRWGEHAWKAIGWRIRVERFQIVYHFQKPILSVGVTVVRYSELYPKFIPSQAPEVHRLSSAILHGSSAERNGNDPRSLCQLFHLTLPLALNEQTRGSIGINQFSLSRQQYLSLRPYFGRRLAELN